jgi:hypothetical protein
LPQH